MQARVQTAPLAAAILLSGAQAFAACPPGQPRGGCVDLDSVPQISQEIVAQGRSLPVRKAEPVVGRDKMYTGPTVGLSKMVRRAPTVGARMVA